MLSKEAVRRFVEDGLPDKAKCRDDSGGAEDVEMGKLTKLCCILEYIFKICN